MMADAADPVESRSTAWRSCYALWSREMRRFVRQRSRIIGALGTPVVFWLLLGAGLRDSLRGPGEKDPMSYLEFSFPGALAAILLFTAIFSMISLIDDRREGFLQGVLVAPAPRSAIALGKIAGASTLAVAQAALFLVFAPLAGLSMGPVTLLAILAVMAIISLAVAGLSFFVAWRQESSQGFHAVMNLLLMPMLVLSGAFFPAGGSARWLQAVIAANPMTYCVALLRRAIYLDATVPPGGPTPSVGLSLGVTLAFAIIMCSLSIVAVNKEGTHSSR